MSVNPFEPPRTPGEPPRVSGLSSRAKLAWRTIVLLMMVPAIYNFLEFNAKVIMAPSAGSRLAPIEALTLWLGNSLLIVVGGIALWLFGLQLINALSMTIRRLFAPQCSAIAWQEPLERALYRAAILAIPGALLWMAWVFGFYEMQMNFYVLSWLIGIPAHILGACVYIPLIYGWYRASTTPNT